jgi:hypothetical protein
MTCTCHHMLFRLSDLCRVLDGKLEGRTPFGRSWRRREDNIKIWGGVNLSGGLL